MTAFHFMYSYFSSCLPNCSFTKAYGSVCCVGNTGKKMMTETRIWRTRNDVSFDVFLNFLDTVNVDTCRVMRGSEIKVPFEVRYG